MKEVRNGMTTEEGKIRWDAYCFPHTYFFSNASLGPGQSPFFSSTLGSPSSLRGEFTKCLHNTATVKQVHNHAPLACLGGPDGECQVYHVPSSLARLHHYRSTCVSPLASNCHHYWRNRTHIAGLLQ